ncbi:MAG: hypothetical protein ABW022_13000 [Actinoplanes sp.]
MKKYLNRPVTLWELCLTALMIGLMQLLVGCSAPAEGQIAPRVVPSSIPVSYVDASQVAAAVGCSSFEPMRNPLAALTQGECSEGVVLATWPSAAGVVDYFTALTGGLIALHITTGSNWSANCDTAELCQDIAARLGGTYTYIPET